MFKFASILYVCLLSLTSLLFAGEKPEVVLTTGHADQINSMVVSPNGRFLASAGNNKLIKIWEISTTQEFRTLSGMDGRVNQMIFSSDNIHLAGMTQQGEVIVWNVLNGEETHRYKNGGIMNGIAFSSDGKRLYHASKNSLLAITDLESGQVTEMEQVSIALTVDTNKQMVYSYDGEGNMNYFSLESESVVKTVKLFEEFVYPFSRSDLSPEGRFLATGFTDDVLRVYDTDEHRFVYESPKYNVKIKDLKFDPRKPYLYLALTDGTVRVFDYKKLTVKKEFKEGTYTSQCLTAHPDGDVVIMANLNVIRFYNVKRNKSFKILDSKVAGIQGMAYDPNGDYLAVATDRVKIDVWDLKLNKRISTIPGFFPCEFTPDGSHLIAQQFNTNVGIWDVETGALAAELPTDNTLQRAIAVSPDGKYVAAGGLDKTARVWDLKSKKRVATLSDHAGMLTAVGFHPTQPYLAVGSVTGSEREMAICKVWNFKSKKLVSEFTEQSICVSAVKFSPDGSQLASAAWDKSILIRDTENWEIQHKLEGHTNMITSIDFDKEGGVLVSGAANNAVAAFDNSVRFWNTSTGAEMCKIQDHYNGVTQVIYDETNDRAFSSSNDGTIKINDLSQCGVVATYVAIEGGDFMIYTPDNYYIASKNALKGIAFRINDVLVPFEQFDVFLNRPDIVAGRIEKSPPQLINAYKYLYKKRLRKLDLDEGNMKLDYEVPRIAKDSKVELVTAEKSTSFWLKAWDDNHAIQQINVFVNDVPVFGENGFRPADEVKSIRKEFEIPLVMGLNKIQVSCSNSNGAESLLESFEVIRQGVTEKHDLYVVAVGVSKYQDDRFDLKYPTKDARDVINKMQESKTLYHEVHTKLLLDEDATKENFEALQEFFKESTHEDLAIIFIAGHGVLNADFDYYFGTHDMDFDSPEERGLRYDRIHAMLNKLTPYKKLLIMDTCHSGELDKEEVEIGPAPDVEEGDVEFRSAGAGVRKKPGFGLDNSVEYMQDMFSDTRKGSGATVISSAGGAEFAMESDTWQNGLFTFSFLSGLDKFAADLNGDRMIQVSEIRAYVNSQVEKLSLGKQIPSSREENISQDYIIFGH